MIPRLFSWNPPWLHARPAHPRNQFRPRQFLGNQIGLAEPAGMSQKMSNHYRIFSMNREFRHITGHWIVQTQSTLLDTPGHPHRYHRLGHRQPVHQAVGPHRHARSRLPPSPIGHAPTRLPDTHLRARMPPFTPARRDQAASFLQVFWNLHLSSDTIVFQNPFPSLLFMPDLKDNLIELIRRTSAEIPDDVQRVILRSLEQEEKNTIGEQALQIIRRNIEMARAKSQPICQDTGSVLFFVHAPRSLYEGDFIEAARQAVLEATRKGYLRQNSVDSLTGKNDGTNLGPGAPYFHFHQWKEPSIEVKLVLKGGGCENVGAQYSLPEESLGADRDLAGCRKVILDAILQAQGKGCGPGVLGVCIGGDRATGYAYSKQQLLRTLDDTNPVPELAALEKDITETANKLGIGPMGFGGKTTLLGTKICTANRVPASYFVSISYMCWAFRRQGCLLNEAGTEINQWLY